MKVQLDIDNELNKYISLLQIESVDKGESKPTKAELINMLAKKGIECIEKEKKGKK